MAGRGLEICHRVREAVFRTRGIHIGDTPNRVRLGEHRCLYADHGRAHQRAACRFGDALGAVQLGVSGLGRRAAADGARALLEVGRRRHGRHVPPPRQADLA